MDDNIFVVLQLRAGSAATVLDVVFEDGDHGGHTIGMIGGDVVIFVKIFGEIEELNERGLL